MKKIITTINEFKKYIKTNEINELPEDFDVLSTTRPNKDLKPNTNFDNDGVYTEDHLTVLKHHIDKDGVSVLIKDNNENIEFWMDVYYEGKDIIANWNQYIFQYDIEGDREMEEYQNNLENFENASEIAIHYCEDKKLI